MLPTIVATLQTNTDIQNALKATIADGLNAVDTTLLSDPTVQQSLSTIVTTLISDLAANPVVQSYIGDAIGAPFGAAVSALLADAKFTGALADLVGPAVDQFLAYPGFNTAITDAINQTVDAMLDGTDASTALQNALTWLQANAAFQAAVGAIIPSSLDSLLGSTDVLDDIGITARTVTAGLLKELGITNEFVDTLAGWFVGATLEALLTEQPVVQLIDDIVVDVLTGSSLSEIADVAIQAILKQPDLQRAVGMSIGQGIGSIFGENPLGYVIGIAAGATATVVIGVAAGIVNLYTWLFGDDGIFAAQPSTTAQLQGAGSAPAESVQRLSTANDLYTMEAAVPDRQDREVLRQGIATDSQFVLAGMSMTGTDDAGPESLEVAMTIEAAGSEENDSQHHAPLDVAFSFPLDRLLSTTRPTQVATPRTATLQQVR